MFYIITIITLAIAVLFGVYLTLRMDKKIEQEKQE